VVLRPLLLLLLLPPLHFLASWNSEKRAFLEMTLAWRREERRRRRKEAETNPNLRAQEAFHK